MSDGTMAGKYHAWAALARKHHDTPRADWLDEQAALHERAEADTDCLKGSPDHTHSDG